jgi:hypothetical protein
LFFGHQSLKTALRIIGSHAVEGTATLCQKHPLQSLNKIQLYTAALRKINTKVELRCMLVLLGCLAIPLRGLNVVLRNCPRS